MIGCSYCTWYRGAASDLSADAVDAAILQLRRVVDSVLVGVLVPYGAKLFVGDGHSDRCVIGRADRIAAVGGGSLARDLAAAGTPFVEFERLDEVRVEDERAVRDLEFAHRLEAAAERLAALGERLARAENRGVPLHRALHLLAQYPPDGLDKPGTVW